MVAVLAILIAAVGVGRRPHVSGGMLLGFGVQTAVLFLGLHRHRDLWEPGVQLV